jgi:hypothetical protein
MVLGGQSNQSDYFYDNLNDLGNKREDAWEF